VVFLISLALARQLPFRNCIAVVEIILLKDKIQTTLTRRRITMRELIILISVCSIISTAHSQNVAVSKLALMTFEGKMEVKASPAQVWAALTDADKAPSWYPYWKTNKPAQALTSIGQTMIYIDGWNNKGKSVVIYIDKGKELRLAHMPDDGSYVCQSKFIIEPKGIATMVTIIEQYSDNLDVPLDKDTAAKVDQEMTQYMAALKTLAEKPMVKK
jgi:hypothetical protein